MFYDWAACSAARGAAGATQQAPDPETKQPDKKMNIAWNPAQKLTPVNGLMLASVRVHAQYWAANPHAESALGYLVSALFTCYPVKKPALR
jgi:hypothetical protein